MLKLKNLYETVEYEVDDRSCKTTRNVATTFTSSTKFISITSYLENSEKEYPIVF